MIRKNNEFLVQKAVKFLKDDPRTTLATNGETPAAVLEALEQEGYHVEELEYNAYYYDEGPQMPDVPQAENCVSEEDFAEAQERYEARMARFTEQTQQLEFDISEGRVRKYAIIGNLDIEIRYEEIEDEEREVTVNAVSYTHLSLVLPCHTRRRQPEELFRGSMYWFPKERHPVSCPQIHLSENLLRAPL